MTIIGGGAVKIQGALTDAEEGKDSGSDTKSFTQHTLSCLLFPYIPHSFSKTKID